MRSVRIISHLIEALTLAATVLFVVLLFQLLQTHVRTNLIQSQTSVIDKVDITIEDYVKNALINFENYLRLSEKSDAQFLFQDFSDIYHVSPRLSVERIIRKEAASQIFPGYDLSKSHLADLLRSIHDDKTYFSSAFQSAETEKLSFYIAKARPGGFVVGRIGLDQIRSNLARLAEYRESIIMIATRDGYVLSSTRSDLPLNVLPAENETEIRILGREYLITRKTSRIFQNDLVILTPLTTVYRILKSIKGYSLIFILFMVVISLVKVFGQTHFLFKPLNTFSQILRDWEVDRDHAVMPGRFLAYREISVLYQSFKEKIEKIRELVTNLRQNEQDLDKMRKYLKNIIDSMPSMLISVDEEGIIKEWNNAAVKYTGLNASEVLGRRFWEVMPALRKYEPDCRDALNNRRQKQLGREVLQNGKELYMDITLFPLIQNGVHEVAFRLDDVTVQERTEQQLRQAQKMETIGTLVGGIAHDFNNILAGIVGTLSIMKRYLHRSQEIPRQKMEDYLNTMEKASTRATDMIRQMLILARRQELALVPVELNGIIEQVVKICTNTFDKKIEIEVRPYVGHAMVKADASQIEQVLLNLAVNAMHAMTMMHPDVRALGGKLIISLTKIYADPYFCSGHLEAQPEISYWILGVQDTGVGMDVKTVAKIFDPFFSTKEKGKGSGLGLTIVYNIVREHKGFIDVYSEPGKGSTFNVFLPVLEETFAVEQVGAEPCVPEGEGTVLIIDDEEAIRMVTTEMLELCGYRALTAGSGTEGISLYLQHRNEIQVILLDINMPVLSGTETMLKLKEVDPAVRILVTSGFIRDERAEALMNLGAAGFVQKPFTLSLLARAIADAIEKKTPTN
jgi:PAS domain S-box-containing protein